MRLARATAARLMPASGLVDDLAAAIGRDEGRRIRLVPYDIAPGACSGLWVETESADYIVYPANASAAERTAVICHEIAHLLLDHKPTEETAQLLRAGDGPFGVDPRFLAGAMARHWYADLIEVEAELLATALVTQLARNADAQALRTDPVSDRLR